MNERGKTTSERESENDRFEMNQLFGIFNVNLNNSPFPEWKEP